MEAAAAVIVNSRSELSTVCDLCDKRNDETVRNLGAISPMARNRCNHRSIHGIRKSCDKPLYKMISHKNSVSLLSFSGCKEQVYNVEWVCTERHQKLQNV